MLQQTGHKTEAGTEPVAVFLQPRLQCPVFVRRHRYLFSTELQHFLLRPVTHRGSLHGDGLAGSAGFDKVIGIGLIIGTTAMCSPCRLFHRGHRQPHLLRQLYRHSVKLFVHARLHQPQGLIQLVLVPSRQFRAAVIGQGVADAARLILHDRQGGYVCPSQDVAGNPQAFVSRYYPVAQAGVDYHWNPLTESPQAALYGGCVAFAVFAGVMGVMD